MQKNSKLRLGVVAAFAAAALALGTAAPAYADPTGPKTLNGAGSDTTQDVMNFVASQVPAIGNWNAVPAGSNITVNSVTFNRPIGSTAGVRALSSSLRGIAFGAAISPATTAPLLPAGTLEWARTSALRTEGGSELTYIPFAGDATSIAFNASSDFPRDVALGTSADATNLFTLRNIYLGTRQNFRDSSGDLITIRPILPQTQSGTRLYWITEALGTTAAAITAGGRATDLGNTVQEHDGRFLTGPGDIAPYSVAQWIAQSNSTAEGLNPTTAAAIRPNPTGTVDRRGGAILGSIDTVKPITFQGTVYATNADFLPSRLVYNVVETRALTSSTPIRNDELIRSTFVGTASTVCAAMALPAQRAFGFTPIANCGATNLQRGFVN